ncbi:MAG: hypothetical protein U0269_01970 [Polyangiales bacterium]
MIPLPPAGSSKPRLNGKHFTIAFVVLLVLGFVGAMALREKRIHDWSTAGGDTIREGVTIPVRRR